MSDEGEASSSVDLGSVSGGQWIICIAAGAVFVAVVIVNFVLRNARRWRALADIRLNVVPPGFRTLQDLPRVCISLLRLASHASYLFRHSLTSFVGNTDSAFPRFSVVCPRCNYR